VYVHAHAFEAKPVNSDLAHGRRFARQESMGRYTCTEYRTEMRLLGLKRRLTASNLSDEEKQKITEEIQKLESEMDMN
jgi:hypothetical protein